MDITCKGKNKVMKCCRDNNFEFNRINFITLLEAFSKNFNAHFVSLKKKKIKKRMLKLLISFSCLTRTALISETEICVKSSRTESYVTANTATHNLHLIFRKPLKSS